MLQLIRSRHHLVLVEIICRLCCLLPFRGWFSILVLNDFLRLIIFRLIMNLLRIIQLVIHSEALSQLGLICCLEWWIWSPSCEHDIASFLLSLERVDYLLSRWLCYRWWLLLGWFLLWWVRRGLRIGLLHLLEKTWADEACAWLAGRRWIGLLGSCGRGASLRRESWRRSRCDLGGSSTAFCGELLHRWRCVRWA